MAGDGNKFNLMVSSISTEKEDNIRKHDDVLSFYNKVSTLLKDVTGHETEHVIEDGEIKFEFETGKVFALDKVLSVVEERISKIVEVEKMACEYVENNNCVVEFNNTAKELAIYAANNNLIGTISKQGEMRGFSLVGVGAEIVPLIPKLFSLLKVL